LNLETIFEIGNILYIFWYVRNFRFDTHVLTVYSTYVKYDYQKTRLIRISLLN
jgi:hypothetical protein